MSFHVNVYKKHSWETSHVFFQKWTTWHLVLCHVFYAPEFDEMREVDPGVEDILTFHICDPFTSEVTIILNFSRDVLHMLAILRFVTPWLCSPLEPLFLEISWIVCTVTIVIRNSLVSWCVENARRIRLLLSWRMSNAYYGVVVILLSIRRESFESVPWSTHGIQEW